ncbi:MAG TPA: cobalamin-binding protein [Candidatus Nanoarchaeia archaeon]|nr:cobalamin-binding protein [Candidatus Nanoarchaeia archaeon]
MNSKLITYAAVIVAIAAILSSAFIYTNMQNQINDLKNPNTPSPNPTSTPSATSTSTSPPAQNITLVDDEGYLTTLTSLPQRVVSLAPSNTQIMFAIGAGNKVVGVTDYDDYPYNFSAWVAAGNMTSVGGYSTPNLEVVASLSPGLILATPINDPDVQTLRTEGYNVLVLNPNNVQGILQDISLVGRAVGADQGSISLINSINTQINAVQATIAAANVTEKPLVYYEIWWNPEMSAGGTSWVNDIINRAGGINVFANDTDQWPTISPETVVQMNPDIILLPTSMGYSPFYGSVSDVAARPGWSSINAVTNNRIVVIDGDLFSECGPRVAQQIQTVAAALYPNLFSNSTS